MCESHLAQKQNSPQPHNQRVMKRLAQLMAGGLAAVALNSVSVGDASAQLIHAQTPTDYHVVKQGDTMWDVSGSYYGDTFEWPRLWSYNPHISNPHWVYPGDILYLKQIDVPTAGANKTNANRANAAEKAHQPVAFGSHLSLGGFVTTEDIAYSGRIIGSPKEATMLAEHDTVWVGFGDDGYTKNEKEQVKENDRTALKHDEDIQTGDIFAIVRRDGSIKNGDGDEIGQKYVVLGSLEITNVSEKQAHTALISQSWQEIKRGDLLIPYERQLKIVQPVQGADDVVARVVDSLHPAFNFGEHQYIYINKGAEDNVRVGNRFFVYQKFEGLDRAGVATDDAIPWQRVGQVLVLDVREKYATAVITDSSREIVVGDRLEMYKGH